MAAQRSAYIANQERARQNYLADAAEGLGANANLAGEERLSAERLGQNTAGYVADLQAKELSSQRDQLIQYSQLYGNLLTEQQRQALQLKIAEMDDAVKRLQIKSNESIARNQIAFQRDQLAQQGSQFNDTLGYNYDVFDWNRSPLNPNNFPG